MERVFARGVSILGRRGNKATSFSPHCGAWMRGLGYASNSQSFVEAAMTNPKDKSSADNKTPINANPLNGVANLGPLFEAQERLLANLAAISSAMFEFSRMRMKHTAAMSGALAGVTDLGEAIELHTKYTRAIVEDGLSTASKIAALSMSGLADSVTAVHRSTVEQRPPLAEAAE
jgi:hypothetical protein